jgi:DNA-binding NarL/FixJ family response regulator
MSDGVSKDKVRILIVEDHALVRDGFVALINRVPSLQVIAEASGASEALSLITKYQPDLVIADLLLAEGNGLDLLKDVKLNGVDVPFLIISMQDEEIYAERCLKAGARGYIMKHSATDEFLDAIETISRGEIYLSKKMNAVLLRRFADKSNATGRSGLESLTDRELQIYQMIGAGLNTRDIAPRLGISPKTVATHRENIKAKLGAKTGRALLQQAMNSVSGS